jgi:hypothetical protein
MPSTACRPEKNVDESWTLQADLPSRPHDLAKFGYMYVPAQHPLQSFSSLEPFIVLYVPALQLEQISAAARDEYIPVGHSKQNELSAMPKPVWNVPGGHIEQILAPWETEYVPAGQYEQTLVLVENEPAWQILHALEPPVLYVPPGHATAMDADRPIPL